MMLQLKKLEGTGKESIIIDSSGLKEIAAISSLLKAGSTWTAYNGIEECRKACGGNG